MSPVSRTSAVSSPRKSGLPPARASTALRAASSSPAASAAAAAFGSGWSRITSRQSGRASSSSGPREADHEHRLVERTLGERFDEVEELRLSPLQIVEDEEQRTLPSKGREQRPDRPGDLLAGRGAGADADRLCHEAADPLVFGEPVDPRASLLGRVLVEDPGCLPNDLGDRPERDPFAVREAPPSQHLQLRRHLVLELFRDSSLPDAGLADERDDAGPSLAGGLGDGSQQGRQLLLAAD